MYVVSRVFLKRHFVKNQKAHPITQQGDAQGEHIQKERLNKQVEGAQLLSDSSSSVPRVSLSRLIEDPANSDTDSSDEDFRCTLFVLLGNFV